MMTLEDTVGQIYQLPHESREKLSAIVRKAEFARGHHLFETGKVCADLYLIADGLVRAYCYTATTELTFWFGQNGDPVMSFNSYIYNQPGYENIELLEPSSFFHFKGSELQQLFATDIHIANWGRKLAESELVKSEERLIGRQFRTATERYEDLFGKNPSLLNRVQLQYIASYLGVTQVTLSRIRAQIL